MNILHGFQTMKHMCSRTRNRAPILVVVSRNSLKFRFKIFVEWNVRLARWLIAASRFD